MKKNLCLCFAILLSLTVLTGCLGEGVKPAADPSSASSSDELSASQPASVPQPGDASAGSESQPSTFRLTIPEGYTLARIAMTLEEMGIGTKEEFIKATQEGDYSEFSLVAQQAADANRCFKLEGYLFPDTYEFAATATHDEIIRTMLGNMENRMSEDLRAAVGQSGYTVDQILALASIIEKESLGVDIMPKVSSVLHNRLDIGMMLQCDVTIKYVEGAIKPFIDGDVDRYNEYYNTYKCPALPAGPICNPGLAAIQAALYPEETPYYYFLTDADGNFYFAETLEEHEENIKTAGI